jgi:hypothetical protein
MRSNDIPSQAETLIIMWLMEQGIFPYKNLFYLNIYIHNRTYLLHFNSTKVWHIDWPGNNDSFIGDIADPDFFEKLGNLLCINRLMKK